MIIKKPSRVSHTGIQRWPVRKETAFPLLCPVREEEWVPEWNPLTVLTNSGFAEKERVFFMNESGGEAIWVVTNYQPEKCRIQFHKLIPGYMSTLIDIHLSDDNSPEKTVAEIRYSYTAFSENAKNDLEKMDEVYYKNFMTVWEKSLNYYLKHKTLIPPHELDNPA